MISKWCGVCRTGIPLVWEKRLEDAAGLRLDVERLSNTATTPRQA